MNGRIRWAALGLAVGFGFAPVVYAQQGQEAHPCAQDAAKLCPGVAPGSGAVAACLKAHKSELSPACKIKVLKAAEKKQERKLEEQMQQPVPPQGGQTPQQAPQGQMPPQGGQMPQR